AESAEEKPVEHARGRHEEAVPQPDLRLGRHRLAQPEDVAEREKHAERVEVAQLDLAPAGGHELSQLALGVAPNVADAAVEFAVKPVMRGRQDHDIAAGANER